MLGGGAPSARRGLKQLGPEGGGAKMRARLRGPIRKTGMGDGGRMRVSIHYSWVQRAGGGKRRDILIVWRCCSILGFFSLMAVYLYFLTIT